MLRRISSAAILALLFGTLAAGSALAAKPDRIVIDVSSAEYEAETEAGLSRDCGFPIDVESTGHIIIHVFNNNPRMVEIDNYRLFETFSANGKSIVVRPDSGPDRVWVGSDGDVYLAIVGRSVTGSGVIGRTVYNLTDMEFVSSHGNDLGDFLAFLCSELAP